MKYLFALISMVGFCGIIVEFADPKLYNSPDHADNLFVNFLWFGFWIALAIYSGRWEGSREVHTRRIRTVQGHLLTHKETLYPVTVSYTEAKSLMETGEWTYQGRAGKDEAGNHYYNDNWIPAGHVVVEDK